jgi:hypothetical protein
MYQSQYEALRSLWLSAFFQWCEDNGIVNPLPDSVRTDLYNIVFKFPMSDQTPLNYPGFWRIANCPDSKADFTSWCNYVGMSWQTLVLR